MTMIPVFPGIALALTFLCLIVTEVGSPVELGSVCVPVCVLCVCSWSFEIFGRKDWELDFDSLCGLFPAQGIL